MLKNKETYEIMQPEVIGLHKNSLVLGKHSGRAAYRDRLLALGYHQVTDEELDTVVAKCKLVADEKKIVTDDDIEAIVADSIYAPSGGQIVWSLKSLHVTAGNLVKPTATVELEQCTQRERANAGVTHDGVGVPKDAKVVQMAAIGSGPIDAVYQAITAATESKCKLTDFTIQSVKDGDFKALGAVMVKLEADMIGGDGAASAEGKFNAQTDIVQSRQFAGRGVHTDILVASANAYINALNRVSAAQERAAAGTNF